VQKLNRRRLVGFVLAALAMAPASVKTPQEWRYYGGDAGHTKYSPLDQINKKNVKALRPVWIFDTGDFSDGKAFPNRSAFEATPLMVDGVLYVTTPFHRVFALDAETGRVIWEFDPKFDRTIRLNLYASRGVAYWQSGSQKRIIVVNQEARLFSIDAATGKPNEAFGNKGVIDLKAGMTEKYPKTPFGNTSPPAVCGDTVVIGSWVGDGEPRGPAGDVRGLDVRTGREIWRFHTVPRPGEFGHDTWAGNSWQDRSGTNVWSLMSVDQERGLVFLPVTSPATDFYGGDRPGANLFGDSVVALDCSTGQRKWHFQTIHHDLWDYDLPSAPVLVTVKRDGKPVDAVAQITKTGFVFLLDRVNGKPLFEVEERPVPKSPIPGEHSSPTQPYPVKPAPFARQSMRMEDMTDVTPESRAACMEMIKGGNVDTKLYDPITETFGVMFPGTNGGANWGGGSFDPTTGTLYVNSMDVAAYVRMAKRPQGSEIPYRTQSSDRFWDKNRYPCQKPPWGSLTAIDLNTGEHRWRSTLGEYDELTARGVPKTGASNLGGSIVTAGGLVFIGATNDGKFRAFDKDTGEEVWTTRLPASAHATPMTYTGPKSGRQFILIASGGGNKYNNEYMSKLVAFALPRNGESSEPRVISAAPPKPRFRADYKGADEKLPGVAPAQPVPFSHRAHAQLRLRCLDCHTTAAKDVRAGLPPTAKCMGCHRTVRADSPHIATLRRADESGGSLPWVRVYKVPDFVVFNHAQHLNAKVQCAECHGAVQERDVLGKEVSTSMTACMNCHEKRAASNACNICHDLGQ
jgi:quinoprotein glucose dehydrogenase